MGAKRLIALLVVLSLVVLGACGIAYAENGPIDPTVKAFRLGKRL